jgi:hypothetical protein
MMKNKNRILSAELKSGGAVCKRTNIKATPHDKLEKVLIEWFEGMHSVNLPING